MGKSSKRYEPSRLAGTLSGMIHDREWEYKFDQYRIFPEWRKLVDEDTAAHSRPLKVVKDVLWLEVENSAWMQQLQFQKLFLLETLNKRLKISRFTDIRLTLRGEERAPEAPGKPVPSVSFVPPPADQVEAFKKQIGFLEDEAIRESLLRLWYLDHACRRD